jgi:hypothetical protein
MYLCTLIVIRKVDSFAGDLFDCIDRVVITLDDNGNSVKVDDGTEEYFKLLEYLGELLPKYTYAANKNGGSQLNIDEARIYIPAFIYVVNGKPIRYITGISDLQTTSREELTEEMLKEEEELFDNFFLNVCDENC